MFNEANAVERMILETVSGARAVREVSPSYGESMGGELRVFSVREVTGDLQ